MNSHRKFDLGRKFEPTYLHRAWMFTAILPLALALFAVPARSADPRPAPAPPPVPAVVAVPPLPPSPPVPLVMDSATGLPVPGAQRWKDLDWPEPDKTLAEVTYDGLQLEQIGEHLQKEFRNAFDVIVPGEWRDPAYPDRSVDPRSLAIRMQLRNVQASEVFHAMNLIFEAENTPCRWELRMNGNRPLAIVRVLPERVQGIMLPPPRPVMRTVYFVGDLVTEPNQFGGDSPALEWLVKTVSEVFEMSYGPAKGVVQFHQKSQLLVVTGNEEQIQFIHQTLGALREKREKSRREFIASPKSDDSKEAKGSPDETKPRPPR